MHPGQLHALFAGAEQTVCIYFDLITSAALVPGGDILQSRPQFAGKGVVAGVLQVFVERGEKPQCRVDGIVFGLFADVGKAVGDHAFADMGGEGAEDILGFGVAPGGQAYAGQGDHGVAAARCDRDSDSQGTDGFESNAQMARGVEVLAGVEPT